MKIKKWRILAFVSLVIMIFPLIGTSIASHDIHEKDTDSHREVTYDLPLICRPKMGYLYVQDREVVSLGGRVTVIIGKITINGETRRDITFDRMEFWIDRTIMSRDQRPPYEYIYDEKTIGWHTIKVIAYIGERTLTDDLRAFIYNTSR